MPQTVYQASSTEIRSNGQTKAAAAHVKRATMEVVNHDDVGGAGNRERQTDRQTGRQTDWQTDRQTASGKDSTSR